MPSKRTIPASRNPDLVTFTIKVEGSQIPGSLQVLSISVGKEVNRIPYARIVLVDGDAATGTFEASSGDLFVPGKNIEILVGFHSDEKTVFKGMTVRQSIRIREEDSRLIVDCRDPAFKATIARQSRYFEDMSDSDIFEELLGNLGLENDVASTQPTHLGMVQYEATDWDFILTRADASGLLCLTDDGKVSITKPDFGQEPIVATTFGATILELDAELDARMQYEGVKAESWDMANQTPLEAEAAEPGYTGPGNLSALDLSGSLGQPVLEMQHTGHLKQEELQAWADAKLQRSRLAKVRGRVRFQGLAEVKPGMMLALQGLGDRFSGMAFVSGVMHQVGRGTWTTDVSFGLSEQWFAQASEHISAAPAAHLLPAIGGLQVGVVTLLEGDPEGEDRIKVRLPMVSPQAEGTWARLACLDAGEGRGMFFRPEIGDEVVVGFLNDHPAHAVVLGSLHSSARPTPEPIADDNFRKGFFSKNELKLTFDDDKKTITLETPGGNILKIDDDLGGISLEDQNGNKIVMDANGIKFESASAIEIKATQDLKVEALNVNLSAQANLKAEGSAAAELSAGGVTTVKGSLVQIN